MSWFECIQFGLIVWLHLGIFWVWWVVQDIRQSINLQAALQRKLDRVQDSNNVLLIRELRNIRDLGLPTNILVLGSYSGSEGPHGLVFRIRGTDSCVPLSQGQELVLKVSLSKGGMVLMEVWRKNNVAD